MKEDAVTRGGATLEKYQLIASLGHGGMADVYLAVLRGPEGFTKLVVVKSMRAFADGDERFRNMLLDEARLAARLRHPNIVQTLEVGDAAGRPFIAMEYLEGQPLNTIVAAARAKGNPLGARLAAYIVREALAGLHYAHELKDYDGTPIGVVHRDISPHNIFVTYEGEVKVVDFGIAKAATNAAQTEIGGVKGKIAYMAPEQARAEALDRRVDVFASGLVLWELLTSRRMLQGDGTGEIVRKLLNEPFPPIGDACPDGSPELEAVVARALAKKQEDRFQSAEEMFDALEPFARGVDRAALGRRLRGMFEQQRSEMEAQIRRVMRPQSASEDSPTITMTVAPGLLLPEIGASSTSTAGPPAGAAASSVTPAPQTLTIGATPAAKRTTSPYHVLGIAAMFVVAAVGYGVQAHHGNKTAQVAASRTVQPAAVAPAEVVLRLQGSETVGGSLAPALVEAFLKKKGATPTSARTGGDTTRITATLDGKSQVVEIVADGSATAFRRLGEGLADIGMSSRPITPEEVEAGLKAGVGDLSSNASEHVIGLDAVSAIVHPNNRVRSFTFPQLAGLLRGDTSDWADLGSTEALAGHITVYAPDDASGTLEVAQDATGATTLAADAKRLVDNEKLSDAVSGDPGGLGFVSSAHVRNARPVPIVSGVGAPLLATPLTIATETYPLTRRLYLYTPERSSKPLAQDLVAFALSPEGQQVVRAAGFVDLNVGVADWNPCTASCPPRYAGMVKRARRLTLDFRFRKGTLDLDSRAPDTERLVRYVREHDGRIALAGFSDAGDASEAMKDSKACARAVDAVLREHGVSAAVVEGFGNAMPVAAGAGDHRRSRNRRVEVWLLDDAPAPPPVAAAPAPASPQPSELLPRGFPGDLEPR